jgi:ubiquinone/menaquinone biosynthesis C-methylase UbiE
LEETFKQGQAEARELVMEAVSPRPGMHILDLACGPGTLTLRLARQLGGQGQVVGVDLAPGMIDLARKALGGRNLPVEFQRMDMEHLNFPARRFDAVTCGHGLNFTPNLGHALREAHRVLKPRGLFAASVPVEGPPHPALVAFRKSLDKRLGAAERPADLEATTAICEDPDNLHRAVLAAGFRGVEVNPVQSETAWSGPRDFVLGQLKWWVYADRVRGFSDHVRDLIAKEVTGAVEKAVGAEPITTPSNSLVVTAFA